jgi:hypothetical protein
MSTDEKIIFFEEHQIPLLRVLTDRGTEYCGQREHHEYELYLAVENIDHSRTKARHPQTNGICERFHRTIQRGLWHGDVFVDFENNLNTAVARLHGALCDSSDHPRFIETLPRRGYRKQPTGMGNGLTGN